MRKNKANNNKKKREEVIKVTSVIDIDKDIEEKIRDHFGTEKIEYKKDPELKGGVKIRKSNKLFDGTIKHQLDVLRHKLYNLKSYDKYN